jgi:hypothetical protein
MVVKSFKETREERKLKKQLNRLIKKYGKCDIRTVEKSQQLDFIIVQRQKALMV